MHVAPGNHNEQPIQGISRQSNPRSSRMLIKLVYPSIVQLCMLACALGGEQPRLSIYISTVSVCSPHLYPWVPPRRERQMIMDISVSLPPCLGDHWTGKPAGSLSALIWIDYCPGHAIWPLTVAPVGSPAFLLSTWGTPAEIVCLSIDHSRHCASGNWKVFGIAPWVDSKYLKWPHAGEW